MKLTQILNKIKLTERRGEEGEEKEGGGGGGVVWEIQVGLVLILM